ncbi:MAG: sugar phosphate isomerase/epimerase [Akkermansiaceae bacterium]|jgi:sugar phosphate isomerase/epimerase|nr:sugar phosphate isomerase/epimerase [Akkermansiaceae bacterium]MCU0778685.1 sugar phosphate isomerase/epimerase [Akkermansiaceae bacterium]
MKPLTSAIIALLALTGTLRAEREFCVFDNGLTDIKSAEEQATLLEKLGYEGICTRPAHATEDFFAAMDRHGIKISASYVVLPAKCSESPLPPEIAGHLRKLKGRKSIVWLALTQPDASDEAAISVIRKVCDLAADSGLEVALYPHVGMLTSTTAACERLRKLADRPNLGVSFNLCHFLCQNDPAGLEATLKSVAPHLKLVQISGADEIPPGKPDWQRLIQPLGQGTFDTGRVIRTLDEIGYKGPVNLQCYQIKLPANRHLAASMKAWKTLNKEHERP